ncbi:DUF488 domain-containing protein [Phenylobacterium aquaticum]|uniref:DUF488 domain-containing protein n=1 Tax=Phenylobacterium aquaticum TaxID=1763816 RepID=UPI0026ED99D0|nr:DUF488 family protein [Phenylobacterium aquaticum]
MSGPVLKRAYDPPSPEDGTRILVDRLWPRGVTKAGARLEAWLKNLSPSDDLRKRVHAGQIDWPSFLAAYASELQAPLAAEAVAELRAAIAAGPVTLVYAAKDPARNNAVALVEILGL